MSKLTYTIPCTHWTQYTNEYNFPSAENSTDNLNEYNSSSVEKSIMTPSVLSVKEDEVILIKDPRNAMTVFEVGNLMKTIREFYPYNPIIFLAGKDTDITTMSAASIRTLWKSVFQPSRFKKENNK